MQRMRIWNMSRPARRGVKLQEDVRRIYQRTEGVDQFHASKGFGEGSCYVCMTASTTLQAISATLAASQVVLRCAAATATCTGRGASQPKI